MTSLFMLVNKITVDAPTRRAFQNYWLWSVLGIRGVWKRMSDNV